MNLNPIVGVWSLVSMVVYNLDKGVEMYPWGKEIAGQLIYTPTKHMAVVFMQHGRQRFVSPDPAEGTDEEIKEAFMKFNAYAGTYDLDLNSGTVTHHVFVCKEPNMEGTSQLRNFKLSEDVLELITPPIFTLGQEWKATLTWQRIG